MEKFKIVIPKPCHENWDEMTPESKGRFCDVCSKTVIDFTSMNDNEMQGFFQENKDKKVCGRFRNEQIEKKFTFNVPFSLLYQKRSFHKAFLLALFVVMGTTLFSCKNFNGQQMGEVAVQEDSIDVEQKGNEEQILTGDTTVVVQPGKEVETTTGLVLPEIVKDTIDETIKGKPSIKR